MIARLRGFLVERAPPDTAVVECGGVGYDVTVSSSTLAALPEIGAEVTLRVFTHATESRIALYGFATLEERQLFDLLITVKNVGPATAIAILSGVPTPASLVRLVAAGDLAGLTKIKGVGKKTADLVVVELREKCELLLATWGATNVSDGERPSSARSPMLDDVASALVNLGWRAAEADKAVAKMQIPPGATVQTLLRDALRTMPR
jgi:Holliday junction DNA helicase RuvA